MGYKAGSDIQKLRRRIKIVSVLLGLTVIIGITLGTGWYLTYNILADARSQLEYQKQETQKYSKLSDNYSLQLNQKTLALDAATIQISIIQRDLETTKALYADTSAKLKSSDAKLEQYRKELELYKDTWGSVVASDVRPLYKGADIVNQSSATNPTWAQLQNFVLNDKTDQKAYVPNVYMCGDYARDVHNNAERLGIRAAYAVVRFANGNHACNAFKTTDRGLVFIDCTGLPATTPGPSNRDKIVSVKLRGEYIPTSLFPEPGWSVAWVNMGTILDVQIYW